MLEELKDHPGALGPWGSAARSQILSLISVNFTVFTRTSERSVQKTQVAKICMLKINEEKSIRSRFLAPLKELYERVGKEK